MIGIIKEAAATLKSAKRAVAFTGAGISVESGIPPFRGENGLWGKYDPSILDLSYFYSHPYESWKVIKEIFYDFFGQAKPNAAHMALAKLESEGILRAVITQNIDNLHQEAGSKKVIEFHGNSQKLICTDCHAKYGKEVVDDAPVPLCKKCEGILKPDFIFFGEMIPEPAGSTSFALGKTTDVMILIGTTGEVMPACNIPYVAKQQGAKIIEVNPNESRYTPMITDIFLQGNAAEVMDQLVDAVLY